MDRKIIRLLVLASLIVLLAACSGSQPSATPTAVPPAVEENGADAPAADESVADAPSEGEDAASEDETAGEDSTSTIDAAALFSANCARCHGPDRVSGSAPDLVPDQLTGDRATYLNTITTGSGPMPAFGNSLSGDEINALVDYILSEPE